MENLPRILIQFTEIMEKEHGIENPPRQHKPGVRIEAKLELLNPSLFSKNLSKLIVWSLPQSCGLFLFADI